ncbi:MAG: hypothetical protein IPN22_00865 [Bacteroidetes bacterium]|nr:hypothetical protein [Bacteroidota bacterium]
MPWQGGGPWGSCYLTQRIPSCAAAEIVKAIHRNIIDQQAIGRGCNGLSLSGR